MPQVARRKSLALRLPLRVGLDLALIVLGFWLAYIVRYELEFPEAVGPEDYRHFAAFIPAQIMLAGILLLVFAVRGVYRLSRWTGLLDEALLIISSSLLGFSALIVTVFYYRPLYFSRLIFFFAFVIVVGLLLAERLIRHGTIAWMHARGRWTDRILVVGAGPAGERVMSALIGERRYDLVGFVEDASAPEDFAVATQYAVVHPNRLGATHDLPEVIREHEIDEVIIALPTTAHDQLYWAIEQCRAGRVPFTLLPDLFELSLDRVEIHSLNGLPLISTQDAGLHGQTPVSKRIFDLVVGGAGLLICGIPMLIIALLIRLDSPGPALYGQTRIGRGGRRFTCYKFRSMYVGSAARPIAQQRVLYGGPGGVQDEGRPPAHQDGELAAAHQPGRVAEPVQCHPWGDEPGRAAPPRAGRGGDVRALAPPAAGDHPRHDLPLAGEWAQRSLVR
jgi:hypothetical protein